MKNLKGIRRSPQTEFKPGQAPWIAGRGHSNESKKRMSASQKIRWQKYPMTEELRNKYSLNKKGKIPKNINMIAGWNKGTGYKSPLTPCEHCGTMFSHRRRTEPRRFCSKQCTFKGLTGNKAPRWDGGKTPQATIVRNSAEYTHWRTAVFTRDDYTCQACAERGGKLHADHELPFSLFPNLRFEVLNGRTLCESCHQQTITWALKGTNHYEQLTQIYA